MSPDVAAIIRMLAAFAVDDYLSELQAQSPSVLASGTTNKTEPNVACDHAARKPMKGKAHDQEK